MKLLLTFLFLILTLPATAQTLSGILTRSENINDRVRNSTVKLTDTVTGEVRLASANQFGFFRFPGIIYGRRYNLEVRNKHYSFGVSSVVTYDDNFGVVLTGQRY